MADRVVPGPVENSASIREAVCVNTRKIFDSCRDKDCVDDLVYPHRELPVLHENAFQHPPQACRAALCRCKALNRSALTVHRRLHVFLPRHRRDLPRRPDLHGLRVR